jgi:5-methyltetrahydrofolate--homocysteine methyltransferase
MGRRTSVAAHAWLGGNRYRDYLYLHRLCVEMAEAFAEHFHERIHGELRFAPEDVRDLEAMAVHGYRGSRHSFGCPPAPTSPTKQLLTPPR